MKELLNGKLMEEALGKLRGLHPELEDSASIKIVQSKDAMYT